MEIAKYVFDEEMILVFPQDIVNQLAACSSNIIVEKVNEYFDNPEANENVKRKLLAAYGDKLKVQRLLNDEQVDQKVELLGELDYGSVHATVSVEELKKYEEAIEFILNNDDCKPYIAPISSIILSDLRADLRKLSKQRSASDVQRKCAAKLESRLKVSAELFKDSYHTPYRGTKFKKVFKDYDKLELILRGVKFLIRQKEKGAMPSTWRIL